MELIHTEVIEYKTSQTLFITLEINKTTFELTFNKKKHVNKWFLLPNLYMFSEYELKEIFKKAREVGKYELKI